MDPAFDVVVVGGGLVGAALGYELAGAGARTLLVDRRDPGRATDAGAGILSPETIAVEDDAWFALAMAAGAHYRELVPALSATGAEDTGYRECGSLRVAFREWDDDLFETTAALIRARAGDVVRPISDDEARAMFPPLGPTRAVLHNPRAARVDGRQITRALVAAARHRGLFLRTGDVTRLHRAGSRVVTVETDRETVDCGAVVVAGGAWTPALGSQLGCMLPVSPVRGQIVHLRLERTDTDGWPVVQPVLSYYVVPWPEGRLAVGGTMEPEAGFEVRSTAGGVRGLLSEVLQLAPGLGSATFLEVRVGLRPVSADDAPILGQLPGLENAFVATGHGANGLLLGPYSARLVAEAVLGRTPSELAPFSPSRFSQDA
jgi:D-amino-acid dehydrogenase